MFFSVRQRPTWWSGPTDGLVELSHVDCWLDRQDWNSRTGALLPCFFQGRRLHGHLLRPHQEVSAEGVKAAAHQKGAPNREGAPPWFKPAENSGNNLKRKKKKKSPQQGYSKERSQSTTDKWPVGKWWNWLLYRHLTVGKPRSCK